MKYDYENHQATKKGLMFNMRISGVKFVNVFI